MLALCAQKLLIPYANSCIHRSGIGVLDPVLCSFTVLEMGQNVQLWWAHSVVLVVPGSATFLFYNCLLLFFPVPSQMFQKTIFQGLSQEVLATCIHSLSTAGKEISKNKVSYVPREVSLCILVSSLCNFLGVCEYSKFRVESNIFLIRSVFDSKIPDYIRPRSNIPEKRRIFEQLTNQYMRATHFPKNTRNYLNLARTFFLGKCTPKWRRRNGASG